MQPSRLQLTDLSAMATSASTCKPAWINSRRSRTNSPKATPGRGAGYSELVQAPASSSSFEPLTSRRVLKIPKGIFATGKGEPSGTGNGNSILPRSQTTGRITLSPHSMPIVSAYIGAS
jgi:hypothetical protein